MFIHADDSHTLSDNLNNRGEETYWFAGENDRDAFIWLKNTAIPLALGDALPKVRRVQKEEFMKR